ncbi:MAG: hypothetical protein IJE08_00105 [Clostridia bacterium]|nr:hypothetical protein [Clostridia bacterium]
MEIRKKRIPGKDGKEREFIFFKVRYNHYRDVSTSSALTPRDREEIAECECVLCLPESYSEAGEETPLILAFHGAGGRVSEEESSIGGISAVLPCVDAGYAALDVCGSEPHGRTMGCPEHLFAAYKAYRYAVKNYNLTERVLVAGASMGGHTAINFVNMFPSVSLAVGIFYPRLNMDGVTVDGHYCIGTWDKTESKDGAPSTRDRIIDIYRFRGSEWSDETTIGLNPYRTRSFVGADGKRVVIPPCPIKIWQGETDTVVDPVMVREYYESVRRSGSYIELRMLEGIGHSTIPVMQEELIIWFNRFV